MHIWACNLYAGFLEILEMMNKCRAIGFVQFCTCAFYTSCHCGGSTTEHSNLRRLENDNDELTFILRMLMKKRVWYIMEGKQVMLDTYVLFRPASFPYLWVNGGRQGFQEREEVGSSEMSDRSQSSKQRLSWDLLEMTFTDILERKRIYNITDNPWVNRIFWNKIIPICCKEVAIIFTHQHGRSQIKLVIELSDKNMNTNEVILVIFFNFTYNVCQPFKMFLSTSHPDEIHLKRQNSSNKSSTLYQQAVMKWNIPSCRQMWILRFLYEQCLSILKQKEWHQYLLLPTLILRNGTNPDGLHQMDHLNITVKTQTSISVHSHIIILCLFVTFDRSDQPMNLLIPDRFEWTLIQQKVDKW